MSATEELGTPYVTAKVVHIKQHPDAVAIDRTGKWGNLYWNYIPKEVMDTFPLNAEGKPDVPRIEKVKAFGTQIQRMVVDGEVSLWDLWDLRKSKLGCWCKDDRKPEDQQLDCHGDILVEAVKWACRALAMDNQIHSVTGEKMVLQFKDSYQFLSNMYKCKMFVDEDGIEHSYSETYYMASKFDDLSTKRALAQMNGFEAKKYSNILMPVHPQSWHQKKDDVMRRAIEYKFRDPVLRTKLLETGDEYLVEGNYHNDKYWGFCLKTGVGLNKLGLMLMDHRAILRQEIEDLKALVESS